MLRLVKFAVVLLVTAPLYAVRSGPLINDPGDPGGGGGACISSSCSSPCPDGSISGIACLSNENAHCACDGHSKGFISQAAPYCTRCT